MIIVIIYQYHMFNRFDVCLIKVFLNNLLKIYSMLIRNLLVIKIIRKFDFLLRKMRRAISKKFYL